MSLTEIAEYISAVRERKQADFKDMTQLMFTVAYKTASLTSLGILSPHSFPDSVKTAFPEVFGEGNATKGIPVTSWQESKAVMLEIQKAKRGNRI